MPTDEERFQQHLRDIGGAPDTPEMRRAWEAEDRAGGGQAPGGAGGWEDQFRQTRREWEDATHRTGEWDRWNPQQREEEFARHAQRLGYGSQQDLEDYLGGREPTRSEGTYDALMRQIADSRAARDGGLYQARPGDTLSGIAERFGLSTEDLLRWNPRADPSLLRVGEIVNLPSYRQAPSPPPRPGGLLGRPPEGQQGGRWVEEAIPMPSPLANPAAFARWVAREKTRRVYQAAPEEAVPPPALEWLQGRLGLTPEEPMPTQSIGAGLRGAMPEEVGPLRPGDLPEEAGNWLERMRQALFPSAEPSLPPEEAARTWEGVTPERMEQATAGRSLETLLGATEPLGWGFTYGGLPLWQMMKGQAGAAPGMATPEQGIVPEQPFEALTPEEALLRGERIQDPSSQLPGRQLLQMMLGQAGAAPGMAAPEVGLVEGQPFEALTPEEALRRGTETPLGQFLERYWDIPLTGGGAAILDPLNALLAPKLWKAGAAALRGLPGMARGAARGAREVAEELAPGARRLLAEEVGGVGGREQVARLRIRAGTSQGQDGFILSGTDTQGRRVDAFTPTRQEAEGLRAALKRGEDPWASPIGVPEAPRAGLVEEGGRIQQEIDQLIARGEARLANAKDPFVRGLHPAAIEWLEPDELSRLLELQAQLPHESITAIRQRVAEKRAARRAGLPSGLAEEAARIPEAPATIPAEVGYIPQIPADRAQEVISQAERGVINRGGGKLLPAMQRWAASEGLSDSEYVQRLFQAENALALGKNLDEIVEAFKKQPFLQREQLLAGKMERPGVLPEAPEQALAESPPGTVRLYRVEGPGGAWREPGAGVPTTGEGVRGGWFTSDLSDVKMYLTSAEKDALVYYVDVPAEVATTRRVANLPEARPYSLHPETDRLLPPELVKARKPVEDAEALLRDVNLVSEQDVGLLPPEVVQTSRRIEELLRARGVTREAIPGAQRLSPLTNDELEKLARREALITERNELWGDLSRQQQAAVANLPPGYTQQEWSKAAGYSDEEIAQFTRHMDVGDELRKRGYTEEEIYKLRYGRDALTPKAAGFTEREIADLGKERYRPLPYGSTLRRKLPLHQTEQAFAEQQLDDAVEILERQAAKAGTTLTEIPASLAGAGVPPPGGVGPPPGGVVPRGRIVPIPKTSDEYLVDLFTPSWRRQAGLLMGKLPVIRQAMQLANPRLLAEDIIARAKIVADMFTDFGRRAPEIIVAQLEVLGPFPFNMEGGLARNVIPKRPQASMFLDDIMQWPGRYNLTPEQTKFISTYHQAIDELTRTAEAVGVKINKLPYLVEKKGAHYIPRIPTGFNPDDSVITSMRRMGAEQTFQKPRTFMTKAEGVAAGVEYLDNPIEVLRIHSRQVYNSMRDAEIASILKSRARPIGVEVPMPAFEGLRFAPDDAKAIMGMVDQQIPGLLRGVAGVNSLLKNLRATADFATWLIQLVTLSHHRPVTLGKAMSRSVADLVNPIVQKRFLVERLDTVEKLLRNGVPISAEAHFLAQEAGITGATLQHEIPLLGPLYKRFESTFGTALTDAAIYTWEALEPVFKRSGRVNWEADLAAHIRNGLGMGMYAGMGPKQRATEASLGFAMSYYRSFMGLLLDFTRGGARGAEARWMLSKLLAGATLGYVGVTAALGQAPRFDPRKGDQFTFDVGEGKDKTRIKYPFMMGMFGSLTKLLGSVVAYGVLEPAGIIEPLPGQEVDMERLLRADMSNPFYRWALGHRAPLLGVVTDGILGKTYLGDPLRAWEDVVRYLGSQFVPFAFGDLFLPSQDVTGEEIGIQTLGFQMYPVSPAEHRNQLREAYATQEFGVPWTQLSSGQRERLINANQDLAGVTQEAVAKWLRQAGPVVADRFNRTEEYWDAYNTIIEDFRQRRQDIPIGQTYDERRAYQEQTKTINALKQRLGLTDDDLFGERPPFPRGPSLLDLGRYLINLFQQQPPPVAQGQPHEEAQARALASSPDMLRDWLKGMPVGIPPGEESISTKNYIIMGRPQEEFNANEKQLFPTLSRVYGALYDAARDPNGIFDEQRFLVLQQEFLRNVPDPLENRWQEWRERNKTPGEMVRDIYGEYVARYYADNEGKTSQERQQWIAQNPPYTASFIAATVLNRWGHRFTQDVNEVDHPAKWHWNDLSEALEGLNIPNIDEYFERRSAQRVKELQETGQPFYSSSGVIVKQNNLDEYILAQQQLDEYMNWLETVWRPAAGLRSQRDSLTARIDRLYDERNIIVDNLDISLEERQKAFTEAEEQGDTFKEQRELIRNRLPTYQNAPALVVKYFFGPPDAEERERLKQLSPEVRAQMVEQEAVPRGGFGGPEPRAVTVAKIFGTMPTTEKGATSEEIEAWWDTNTPRLKELGWRQEPFKEEVGRLFDTMPDFGEKPTKEQRAILSQWWDDNKPRLLELGWTPKWESQIADLAREWWDERRQRGERTSDTEALATHLEAIGMGDRESLKIYIVGPGANDLEKSYIWSEYYGLQAAGKKDEASQYFQAKKSRLKELGWETTPEQDEIDQIFEEYNTRKATNKKDAYNWLESMKPRLSELGFEFKNGGPPTTTPTTRPGEIASTANVAWWDVLTTEGTPEWRREFEEVHNRPPNNIDYFRDYLWSLDFQRSKGRGPSRSDWVKHYWDDVRRGRPRTTTPEFAPRGNGNRTLTNAQWSNVQTLLGRTGTNELIGSRFVPGSMSEGTRNTLQRFYREHPYGARSFEDWLSMAKSAFQRE